MLIYKLRPIEQSKGRAFLVLLIFTGLKEITNLLQLQQKEKKIRGLASRTGDNKVAGS